MKKIFASLLLISILILGSIGLMGCTGKDTNNFDNLPISVESKWFVNKEGLFCLKLSIKNNSENRINDIQASIFWKYKDQDGITLTGSNGYSATTLFWYDIDGNEMRGHPKISIKPGDTFDCVVYKISGQNIAYQFDVDIYITWINFSGTDNWGAKDLIDDEQNLASYAPHVYVHPINQVSQQ